MVFEAEYHIHVGETLVSCVVDIPLYLHDKQDAVMLENHLRTAVQSVLDAYLVQHKLQCDSVSVNGNRCCLNKQDHILHPYLSHMTADHKEFWSGA